MAVPVSLALSHGGFAAVNPALVAAVVPGGRGCLLLLAGGATLDIAEPQDLVVRKLFPPPPPKFARPGPPGPGPGPGPTGFAPKWKAPRKDYP